MHNQIFKKYWKCLKMNIIPIEIPSIHKQQVLTDVVSKY